MFTVIYNPIAGKHAAQKTLPAIYDELKARGIAYEVRQTQADPSTNYLADVPCSSEDTVCVVGGDGTVLNVLNALPSREMRLITVPCGTGNDFIKCLKLPKNPIKALKAQLDSNTRGADYATVNGKAFLNVFGTGFDVEVLKKLDLFKDKYTGLKAYLKALKVALKEYEPIKLLMSVDDGEVVEKSMSILSVGNGQYIGGGMKAVPSAVPWDGFLDVVEVRPVKKSRLLMLLPTFVLGLHIKVRLRKTYRCKKLMLRGKNLSYQIDGEIHKADTIELNIVENKLQLYVQ